MLGVCFLYFIIGTKYYRKGKDMNNSIFEKGGSWFRSHVAESILVLVVVIVGISGIAIYTNCHISDVPSEDNDQATIMEEEDKSDAVKNVNPDDGAEAAETNAGVEPETVEDKAEDVSETSQASTSGAVTDTSGASDVSTSTSSVETSSSGAGTGIATSSNSDDYVPPFNYENREYWSAVLGHDVFLEDTGEYALFLDENGNPVHVGWQKEQAAPTAEEIAAESATSSSTSSNPSLDMGSAETNTTSGVSLLTPEELAMGDGE